MVGSQYIPTSAGNSSPYDEQVITSEESELQTFTQQIYEKIGYTFRAQNSQLSALGA